MPFQRGNRLGVKNKKTNEATVYAEKARAYIAHRVFKELEPLVTAQIESAKGFYILDKNNKIYKKEPNNSASDSLMNRFLGKPSESLDVTSAGKPIIQISNDIASKYGINTQSSNNR